MTLRGERSSSGLWVPLKKEEKELRKGNKEENRERKGLEEEMFGR